MIAVPPSIKVLKEGDWSDTAIWQGEILPPLTDTIIISHNISLDHDLTILPGGYLRIISGVTLCGKHSLLFECGSYFYSWGTVKANGVRLTDGYNYGFIQVLHEFAMSPCLLASFTGAFTVGIDFDCNPCPIMFMTFSITDSDSDLNNGAVSINATGGQPPYLYTVFPSVSQESNTFTGLSVGSHWARVVDANGCQYEEMFYIGTLPVDVKEIHPFNEIKVFPNPFSDRLNIQINKVGQLDAKLMDAAGRVINSLGYTGTMTCAFILHSEIPEGIYFLEIRYNDKISIQKVFKR